MRALIPGLATVIIAVLPIAVPLAVVVAGQPPPRRASAVPAPVQAADRVLIVIAPGEPAWPEPPPPPDATTTPSPVAYDTGIIAQQLGDELRQRGIAVRVEAAERIGSAETLLGYELVVLAWPARRFHLGAGLQALIDRAWEPAVRDRPGDIARTRWAAVTIAARADWAAQAQGALAGALAAGGASLADQRVFLTALTGAEVEAAKLACAERLAILLGVDGTATFTFGSP